MVPEGWSAGKVSTIIKDLESGVSVNGEDRVFDKDEKAVLKVSAVTYGTFNPNAAKVINSEELKRAKTNPKKGQVIISRSNTESLVGASAFIDKDYPNLFLPDKLWQTVPQNESNMKWLSYLLASARTRYTLSNLATGTSGSMKNITKSALLDLVVPIPPYGEQKKIAQILSIWDKAITTTEQLLANSQQKKKALMQQLLTGKKRLLDDNGVRFNGKFKRHQFSELLEIDAKSLNSTTPDNFEFDYISLSDVDRGVINENLELHTYKNAPSRARRIVSEKDILLATVRPNLQAFAQITKKNSACIVSTGFSVLTAKEGTCSDYIYQYLFSAHITGQINALVVGTNYPAINSSDVSGLNIYCPNVQEQQKIAAALSAADQEIDSLQQKIDALKQEKKALMQQLLTGKRRVKVEDVA